MGGALAIKLALLSSASATSSATTAVAVGLAVTVVTAGGDKLAFSVVASRGSGGLTLGLLVVAGACLGATRLVEGNEGGGGGERRDGRDK